nr:unnamed protein product [Callosobruchus analis]
MFCFSSLVRQGCVLSPILYDAYTEEILKKALKKEKGGIKIGGTRMNNLRYTAGDTMILAKNVEDLQKLITNLLAVKNTVYHSIEDQIYGSLEKQANSRYSNYRRQKYRKSGSVFISLRVMVNSTLHSGNNSKNRKTKSEFY